MSQIKEILENTKTIAVIGMKDDSLEAAYKVPFYMHEQGYKIYPVNPMRTGKSVLDEEFYDNVNDIRDPIDLVNIFRRPEFITGHVNEILSMNPLPKYVWFQLGIYNDIAARELEKHGIIVVQNRCIMVEHSRLNIFPIARN